MRKVQTNHSADTLCCTLYLFDARRRLVLLVAIHKHEARRRRNAIIAQDGVHGAPIEQRPLRGHVVDAERLPQLHVRVRLVQQRVRATGSKEIHFSEVFGHNTNIRDNAIQTNRCIWRKNLFEWKSVREECNQRVDDRPRLDRLSKNALVAENANLEFGIGGQTLEQSSHGLGARLLVHLQNFSAKCFENRAVLVFGRYRVGRAPRKFRAAAFARTQPPQRRQRQAPRAEGAAPTPSRNAQGRVDHVYSISHRRRQARALRLHSCTHPGHPSPSDPCQLHRTPPRRRGARDRHRTHKWLQR